MVYAELLISVTSPSPFLASFYSGYHTQPNWNSGYSPKTDFLCFWGFWGFFFAHSVFSAQNTSFASLYQLILLHNKPPNSLPILQASLHVSGSPGGREHKSQRADNFSSLCLVTLHWPKKDLAKSRLKGWKKNSASWEQQHNDNTLGARSREGGKYIVHLCTQFPVLRHLSSHSASGLNLDIISSRKIFPIPKAWLKNFSHYTLHSLLLHVLISTTNEWMNKLLWKTLALQFIQLSWLHSPFSGNVTSVFPAWQEGHWKEGVCSCFCLTFTA